jgi:hypothetical protein
VQKDYPPLVFAPEALPDAYVGQPYEVEIEVSDNKTPVFDISLKDGSQLPVGLALDYPPGDGNTATLGGTPAYSGKYIFIIQAKCYGTNRSGQVGEIQYTLLIK